MTRSKFATAHKELDLVFGTEFRRVTAEQATLLCEDVLAVADEEQVSLGYAATILYRRVYAGNLAAYAACLVAGKRNREREAARLAGKPTPHFDAVGRRLGVEPVELPEADEVDQHRR